MTGKLKVWRNVLLVGVALGVIPELVFNLAAIPDFVRQRAAYQEIPLGTSADEMERLLASKKLKCSLQSDTKTGCSLPNPWLIFNIHVDPLTRKVDSKSFWLMKPRPLLSRVIQLSRDQLSN